MKSIKIEIKWAILFVVMMLCWMLMEKLTGLHDVNIEKHPLVSNFVAIPAILMYVFALIEKRNKFYQGKMTYSQGFKAGLLMTIFVTILSPLTQYITSVYISPEYFENVTAYSVQNNLMTEQEALEYFNLKNYMITTLVFTPVMGIVTTLIVAVFTRRK